MAFRERAPSVSVLQTDITHSWDDADIVRRYASKRTLFPFESYLFGKYIPNGSRILDLGVGAGRTTASLADGAKSYVGIDYSPGMVEACRKARLEPRLNRFHVSRRSIAQYAARSWLVTPVPNRHVGRIPRGLWQEKMNRPPSASTRCTSRRQRCRASSG